MLAFSESLRARAAALAPPATPPMITMRGERGMGFLSAEYWVLNLSIIPI
jgi:hypothetical protein